MSNNNEIDLEKFLKKKITVYLKGNKKLEGTLEKYDDYMNLVLKNATEHENEKEIKEHELAVIKGGNVLGITA